MWKQHQHQYIRENFPFCEINYVKLEAVKIITHLTP